MHFDSFISLLVIPQSANTKTLNVQTYGNLFMAWSYEKKDERYKFLQTHCKKTKNCLLSEVKVMASNPSDLKPDTNTYNLMILQFREIEKLKIIKYIANEANEKAGAAALKAEDRAKKIEAAIVIAKEAKKAAEEATTAAKKVAEKAAKGVL